MTWRRRAAAIAMATAGAALLVSGCGGGGPDAEEEAIEAAEDFLDRYLDPSGRIVRTDQGSDTVSEGQAYGMLFAVALGDEERFRDIWGWTDVNLQRDDGLLSWRWADGEIVDGEPAGDADLLAATALAFAARRFADPDLLTDAGLINDAIIANETMTFDEAIVLAAGPWAVSQRVINPSYLVTPAMSGLFWRLDESRWADVAATSREMLDELTEQAPHLPPDWATVDADGDHPEPQASPAGETPRYGWEAGRVLVQLAVDCRGTGQRIAARAWPFLEDEIDHDRLVAVYSMDGEALVSTEHPLALVAAASSAAAAGERERAAELLDEADELDDDTATYYGAAWIALARLWHDTDLLGACRPGHPTTP